MPRKPAVIAGVFALALSLMGIPGAAAQSGGTGELHVAPGSVAPGQSVTLSVLNPELMDQMDDAHRVTVHSDAFAGPVRLAPSGKVSWRGRATVRCDTEPGAYTLRFDRPVPPDEARTNGRVKVVADTGSDPRPECAAESEGGDWSPVTVTISAAALAALATLAFVTLRRRRRS